MCVGAAGMEGGLGGVVSCSFVMVSAESARDNQSIVNHSFRSFVSWVVRRCRCSEWAGPEAGLAVVAVRQDFRGSPNEAQGNGGPQVQGNRLAPGQQRAEFKGKISQGPVPGPLHCNCKVELATSKEINDARIAKKQAMVELVLNGGL